MLAEHVSDSKAPKRSAGNVDTPRDFLASAHALRTALSMDAGETLARMSDAHTPHLYRLCLGILHHREDAEDAVQETLYRALRNADSYRGDASVRTWLTRIAINVCIAARSRPHEDQTVDGGQARETGEARTEAPALARVLLEQALSTLSHRQRAILLLKEMSGWTVREIAEANGWSETRVKLSLYRSRRRLGRWASSIKEEV